MRQMTKSSTHTLQDQSCQFNFLSQFLPDMPSGEKERKTNYAEKWHLSQWQMQPGSDGAAMATVPAVLSRSVRLSVSPD